MTGVDWRRWYRHAGIYELEGCIAIGVLRE